MLPNIFSHSAPLQNLNQKLVELMQMSEFFMFLQDEYVAGIIGCEGKTMEN